jgi:hypothetical protein
MSDEVWFSQDPEDPLPPSPNANFPAHGYQKPRDQLNVPPVAPDTVFYLAIIKPHTDTYDIHGPVKKFVHLLPKIEEIVSNSPNAIDKLDELKETEDCWGEREKNDEFFVSGFERLVVEGQRSVFTVLKVIREVDKEVFENLPAPVYTLISSGPLKHAPVPVASPSGKGKGKGKSVSLTSMFEPGKPKGYALSTRLHGSYVERAAAQEAAKDVMADLVGRENGVKISEKWDKGSKGGGLLMAMSPDAMWEVKVVYEDEALKRAMDDSDLTGEGLRWR